MRVKIAYTVELEEVEREVSEIMCRAASDLDFAYQEVAGIQADLDTKTGDLESKLASIDAIRRKMMKADQTLEDCHAILEGYDNALKQLEEQENENETEAG
tara:strand:+ start:760 stop:1062 length:303 start_codon:yes stop_codon:yes gene_type:complete